MTPLPDGVVVALADAPGHVEFTHGDVQKLAEEVVEHRRAALLRGVDDGAKVVSTEVEVDALSPLAQVFTRAWMTGDPLDWQGRQWRVVDGSLRRPRLGEVVETYRLLPLPVVDRDVL